ncbi:unnamed protein product [Brugia pahangi]|uniref:Four helix bundle protein n=1 Tax=Brugia pahangi TaxID=6280 RepID=A0A0N4T534_BRUPA|nr:unnamed protein product [Brugia pahangi]
MAIIRAVVLSRMKSAALVKFTVSRNGFVSEKQGREGMKYHSRLLSGFVGSGVLLSKDINLKETFRSITALRMSEYLKEQYRKCHFWSVANNVVEVYDLLKKSELRPRAGAR